MHAQYQNIATEFARAIEELVAENELSPEDIVRAFLVLGGDHGQGAFQLYFKALLVLVGFDEPVHKTKSIAEVYCAKEEGTLLDESITPWMNEDLKTIKDLRLILKRPDVPGDHRSCEWRSKASVTTGVAMEGDILPDTILLQSADLAFTAYTLDKEGMSSKYCPYCSLTKAQWMLPVGEQPILEPWTMPRMIAMCDDNSKKGPQKVGIKCHPKVPSMEVSGLIHPATHMGIGVNNDIVVAFEDTA